MTPILRDDAIARTIIHEALVALNIALAYVQLVRIRMERDPLQPDERLVTELTRAEAAVLKTAARLRDLEQQVGP